MATAATRAISKDRTVDSENIIDFDPEKIKAPFVLRCAALSIDYMLLLALPVGWLAIGRLLVDRGSVALGSGVWILGFLLFAGNFLLFPLLRGQSLGKMITGLTILNINGTRLTMGVVLRRNLLGYTVTVLTGGIGFVIAAVNESGRALHDFTAGTVVVRGRKNSK